MNVFSSEISWDLSLKGSSAICITFTVNFTLQGLTKIFSVLSLSKTKVASAAHFQ